MKSGARSLALAGVMAATLIGGKTALAALPNVEVVTLLCAAYGYAFGPIGLAAVFVFVLCEPLIWGVGPWVISYFIYWPLVCLVFMALKKRGVRNRWAATAAAVALTLFFGVLTSLVDVGLFTGLYNSFWLRFSIYYARGIVYYVIQLVCNAILFPALFLPLTGLLVRYAPRPARRAVRRPE